MKINEVRKNTKNKESEYITKKIVKGGGKYNENKKYVLIFENNETGNTRAKEMCQRIVDIYELGSFEEFLNKYKIQLPISYRELYLLLITYLDIYTLLYEIMDKDNFNESMDEFLGVLYNEKILEQMKDLDYVTKYEIQQELNILESYKLIAKSIVDNSITIKNKNDIKRQIDSNKKFNQLKKLENYLQSEFGKYTFNYLERVFEKIYKKKCSILRRIISKQDIVEIRNFVLEKLKRNENNRHRIDTINNSNMNRSYLSKIKYDKTQKVIKPPLKQYLFSLFGPLVRPSV